MYKIIKRVLTANRSHNLSLLLRGGISLLRARLLRRPVLKYLDVAIDYRCNMRCQHCFAIYSLKNDGRQILTLADWQRVSREAIALGCLHVNIQGGEPFILDNLTDYIRAFNPGKCHVSITTNGSCLTEEKIKSVQQAGASQLIFSLDSMEASTHDEFRALPGAHQKVMAGIALARELNMPVAVNVTVSHESLQTGAQKELFAWLRQERIPFNPILACGVGGWSEQNSLLVDKQDVEYVEELCADRLGQRDLHASWVKQGCSATAEQAYITAYGDVIPCPFVQVSLGNLQQQSLGQIWREAISQGYYGHYNPRCWVAQEAEFAGALTQACKGFNKLPIPADRPEGREVLKRFWSSQK